MKRHEQIVEEIKYIYSLIRTEMRSIRDSFHAKYRLEYVKRHREAIAALRAELTELCEVKQILDRLESEAIIGTNDLLVPSDEQTYETLLVVIPRIRKLLDRE